MHFSSLESQAVNTRLGCLSVRVVGEGPPILFWPSLTMSSEMWLGVAEALQASYRLVLVDPPGQGDSALLAEHFDLATSAECIPEILDALCIGRAHVVGNSWGGMIGGTFAARHPDRIGAAVLMNATASAASFYQKAEYALLARMVRALNFFPAFTRRRAVQAFLGPTSEREQPLLVRYIEDALLKLDPRSASYAIESVVARRPDQTQLFRTIRTPVLVVAGDEDRTFPLDETKAMASAIPGAEFIVMSGVAHLAGLEQPAQTVQLIRDFLAKHPL